MNNIIIVSMILITAIGLILILSAATISVYASHKAISKIKHAINKGLDQLNNMITPTTNTTTNTTGQIKGAINKGLDQLNNMITPPPTTNTTTNQTGNRTSLPVR
jgi:hypothetical protein